MHVVNSGCILDTVVAGGDANHTNGWLEQWANASSIIFFDELDGLASSLESMRWINLSPPNLIGSRTRQFGKALQVNLFSRDRMNLENKFEGGDKKVKPKNGVVEEWSCSTEVCRSWHNWQLFWCC
ncbi:hypothetical protein Tco_0328197 [Tanacetum coccineum]